MSREENVVSGYLIFHASIVGIQENERKQARSDQYSYANLFDVLIETPIRYAKTP